MVERAMERHERSAFSLPVIGMMVHSASGRSWLTSDAGCCWPRSSVPAVLGEHAWAAAQPRPRA
jgi:hypothetical protein